MKYWTSREFYSNNIQIERKSDSMNIEKMTAKQLAKEIIARKVAIKENEEFVKKGLEELRNRNIEDITTSLGMIYSIEESTKIQMNQTKLKEFLGDKIKDFQNEITIAKHYAIKPNR